MTPTRSFRALPALAAAALLSTALAPLPALALDGQDLLAKINAAQAANGGLKVSAATVDVSGDNAVLKDATLSLPEQPGVPEQSVRAGDIGLTDVEKQEDGGYVIGEVAIPSIKSTNEGTELSVGAISMSNLVIPGQPDAPGLKSVMYYDKATFGPITVTTNGQQYLAIGAVEASMTPAEDEPGIAFETYARNVAITPPPAEAAWLTDFGLSTLRGELAMSGSWFTKEGTISVDEVTLSAEKLGTLSLSLGLDGMTEQLYASMKQTAESLKAPGGDAQSQAGQLALFGIAQQVNVSDASLSFEDDGFTARALDYAGKKQGITAKQAGEAAKAMVPLILAQYGVSDPQGHITQALQTFLADPQNLTIEYAPEKAVPVMTLFAAPMTLLTGPDTTITANEDED